jgi:hypothetical protein
MAQSSCSWVGQLWVCNNNTPAGGIEPYNYAKILQDGQNLVPNWAEQDAALVKQKAETERIVEANEQARAMLIQQEKMARLRQSVGTLVADGKCPDAIDTAMRSGDFELAREVRDICKGVYFCL